MFERQGIVKLAVKDKARTETLIELGLESGAEDFNQETQDGTTEMVVSSIDTSTCCLV